MTAADSTSRRACRRRGALLAFGLLVLAAPAVAPAADHEVRALLIPRQETVLAAETSGRVDRITVDMGQRFDRGQALVVVDSGVPRARRRMAQAELEEARHTYQSNRELERLQSVSAVEVAVSRARMQRAEAEVALQEHQIDRCTVTAPFAGRVVRREVQPFAFVTPGQPLLEIVDDRTPELQLLVPSSWIRWLEEGTSFRLRVDETGGEYRARVAAVGARVDPVSQTLEARARLEGNHPELLAGMSGTAVFAPPVR